MAHRLTQARHAVAATDAAAGASRGEDWRGVRPGEGSMNVSHLGGNANT